MGYIRTKTPLESEMALREKLPKKHWGKVNYLLVAHGQNVCRPISPHCSSCHLRDLCQRKNVSASR
jgi:endonuclease III